MNALNRDDTEHGRNYYQADDVDAVLATHAMSYSELTTNLQMAITLLDKVLSGCTRNDDLPDDLVQDIERFLGSQ
jgi:hypothetical protein